MSVTSRRTLQLVIALSTSACLISSVSARADTIPLSNSQLMQMVNQPSSTQAFPVVEGPGVPQNTAHSNSIAALPGPDATPATTASEPGLAELHVSGSYDISPSDSINGGSSYGIDTLLYSAPIGNWRLFAGEYFTHEDEPIGEGTIGYSRSMAGAEYSGKHLVAEAAPTYNHFDGSERIGATGDGTWTFNDMWSVGAGAQYFSRDIPLRALNSGITANSYDLNASWTQNTQRDIRVDATAMNFSDGNFRSSLGGVYTEHIIDSSRLALDGLINVIESQNTKDENRPYFNPDHDGQGMIGARVTQPLYTQSSFLWEHSLEVTPGAYYQEAYGTSAAFNAKYAQRVHLGRTFDGGVAIDYSRQAYDGVAQNDETILFDLTERF